MGDNAVASTLNCSHFPLLYQMFTLCRCVIFSHHSLSSIDDLLAAHLRILLHSTPFHSVLLAQEWTVITFNLCSLFFSRPHFQVGTIGGTYLAALFIHKYNGWHEVFYFFGLLTIGWCLAFVSVLVTSHSKLFYLICFFGAMFGSVRILIFNSECGVCVKLKAYTIAKLSLMVKMPYGAKIYIFFNIITPHV